MRRGARGEVGIRNREEILHSVQDDGAMGAYYVYILTNMSRTLYVGVTNDLQRRVHEHKNHVHEGFTSRYNLTMLAYYETFPDIGQAIAAERRIKGWTRAKKVALIESANPDWRDLSRGWYDADAPAERTGVVACTPSGDGGGKGERSC